MKIPKWLIRRRTLFAGGIALVLVGELAYGVTTGKIKTGISSDEKITKSEKKGANGKTIETVTTTTFEDGKTLWDWGSLIVVPLSGVVLGWWLQRLQQKQTEEQARREKDNQREEVLQAYFDRISTLLIDKNVLAISTKVKNATGLEGEQQKLEISEQEELLDTAADVVRARTLSILRQLENDPVRKGAVLRFLSEAEVIRKLDINLSQAELQGADLAYANLAGAKLIEAKLIGTDLEGANLKDTVLIEANLQGANLQGAYLQGAELQLADLQGADLTHAKLTHAVLQGADLTHADLGGAYFTHADLGGAYLIHADLQDADLQDADLRGAVLTYAKLQGANLKGANLKGAELIGAELTDAKLDPEFREELGLPPEKKHNP